MKIGILTVHRAHNFGAVLQCYALMTYLKSKGHDVEIIDYRQPFIEKYYRAVDFRMIIGNLKQNNWNFLLNIRRISKKRKESIAHYKSFRETFFSLSVPCYSLEDIPDYYDCYVIGSDQIWNQEILGGKVDQVFWGNFKDRVKGRITTYAASSRLDKLDEIPMRELSMYLSNFDMISIRENDCKEFLETHTDKRIKVVIDPTLLLPSPLWKNIISDRFKASNHVVLYEVRRNKKNPKVLYEKAKLVCETLAADLVDLSKDSTMSPCDFVSAIYYARYVVTSSFHGTAFSIIFHKNFTTYKLNDGRDSRYQELLQNLCLTDLLKELDEDPIMAEPDYGVADSKLAELKSAAKSYIKKALYEECQQTRS